MKTAKAHVNLYHQRPIPSPFQSPQGFQLRVLSKDSPEASVAYQHVDGVDSSSPGGRRPSQSRHFDFHTT